MVSFFKESLSRKFMKSIDKCKDMMLGIAVGDAFGAGYEGMTPEQIGRCYYALKITGKSGRREL